MRLSVRALATFVLAGLLVVGCAQSAPAPTQAPAPPPKAAEPTKAAAPAAPTAAPAAAPTKAPAPAPKVEYPVKGRTVTFIVPWAAGGSVDTQARLLAPALEKDLGVPVQVVNKAGANGQVGLTELVKAKPDGHTIAIVTLPSAISNYLDPDQNAIYTRKDFQPVVHQVFDPEGVAVKADSPFKDMKDVVDAAKANPGGVKFGITGVLGDNHLALLQFQKTAGVKFTTVAFDGFSPAAPALLGGHIDAIISTSGNYASNVKSGAMRLIGIMDKEPSKFYPTVKTFRQQGWEMDFGSSRGVVLPAGTPKEITERLSSIIKSAMASDVVANKMDEMYLKQVFMDTEAFAKFWADFEVQTKPLLDEGKAELKKQ